MTGQGSIKRIDGGVYFLFDWWNRMYGFEMDNPMTTAPEQIVEERMWMERKMYEHFPDIPLGNPDPKPSPFTSLYDPAQIIAIGFGAPEPTWDPKLPGYHHDRELHVWDWVYTVADVDKITVPVWENIPCIQSILRIYDRLKELFPDQNVHPKYSTLDMSNYCTGEPYEFAWFVSFIDLGQYLFGFTRFLEILGLGGDFVMALLSKCLEITCSFTEYFLGLEGKTMRGVCSLGGDCAFFLSPEKYRRYAVSYDMKILDRYGPHLPTNLHSCGPSSHLFDEWSAYPNVAIMQTRYIPGKMKRLRRNLPNTHLMITIAQPQFDWRLGDPEVVVVECVEDLGLGNLYVDAIIPPEGNNHDENVRLFYRILKRIRNE